MKTAIDPFLMAEIARHLSWVVVFPARCGPLGVPAVRPPRQRRSGRMYARPPLAQWSVSDDGRA
jgi:hypothetical protein